MKKNARNVVVALLVMAGLGTAVGHAQATPNPPERMTYQGFLVDANGLALGNTAPRNYDIVFRIWTAQTGGTRLWSEQQTVTVDKGFFNVLLGEGSAVSGESRPLLSAVFTGADVSDRYVAVTVKAPGLGTTDVEIAPRLRLLTVPFAFLSRQAVSVVNASGTSLVQGNGASLQINVPVQAAGGNGRGSNATDLQVSRVAVDQVASGNGSTIAGGQNNRASGVGATVAGGTEGVAAGSRATVGGGVGNAATGDQSTVAGGSGNTALGTGTAVGGGAGNRANGVESVVAGGSGNTAGGLQATVAGGGANVASADRAAVGGGGSNTASGNDATVPGGRSNVASGAVSMAAGYRAKATHNGSWVWADSVDADFGSQANNEVAMRATGGVRIAGDRPASSASKQVSITDTTLNSPNFALQLGYRFQPGVMAQGLVEAVDNNNPGVLSLQPRGGSVGIGKDTLPTSMLDVNGVVTATRFVGDGTIPVGAIVMWSGQVTAIPSGWSLCDGANGTPDLRSRFVVGASGATGPAGGLTRYSPWAVGGKEAHALTVAEMPSHSHRPAGRYIGDPDGGWDTRGEGNHYLALRWGSDGYGADQAYQRTSAEGGNQAHETRPPYFALAFIMRTR